MKPYKQNPIESAHWPSLKGGEMEVGFCTNSNRWVDFMLPKLPESCPYLHWQGSMHCRNGACDYYKEREPTKAYKRKIKAINECFK
jgi:hypothetical protein